VGLLSKDNLEEIPFAYKLYKSSSQRHNKVAARFKKAFCREIPIEFLGVWSVFTVYSCPASKMTIGVVRDTVASVGILNRRTLPFVGGNNTIKVFRHALSLDEVCGK
jgi:uncharacterized protein (DUF2235 family)